MAWPPDSHRDRPVTIAGRVGRRTSTGARPDGSSSPAGRAVPMPPGGQEAYGDGAGGCYLRAEFENKL